MCVWSEIWKSQKVVFFPVVLKIFTWKHKNCLVTSVVPVRMWNRDGSFPCKESNLKCKKTEFYTLWSTCAFRWMFLLFQCSEYLVGVQLLVLSAAVWMADCVCFLSFKNRISGVCVGGFTFVGSHSLLLPVILINVSLLWLLFMYWSH